MGTQVHIQLHTGRIPAEHFYYIGNSFSYIVKKVEASLPQPYPLNDHELVHAVFLVELLDTSTCLVSLLLSGVEWMALRTNFNVDFRLGRSCNECVTTVAGYGCLIVIWMDSFSHNFTSSMSYRFKICYITLYPYTRSVYGTYCEQ